MHSDNQDLLALSVTIAVRGMFAWSKINTTCVIPDFLDMVDIPEDSG